MAIEDEFTTSPSSQTWNPLGSISVLVVDDDTTCLSIVAAILKSWKYEVVTAKHPIDALCTLRIKEVSFDLVVTDVHMPDMNGFELQKRIEEEFKLPVVFMSADNKDSIKLKGLRSGAAFFFVKPISPNDLKNLWQYAVAKKKGKSIIKEVGSTEIRSTEETSKAHKVCLEGIPLLEQKSQNNKTSKEETISIRKGKRKASSEEINAEKTEKNNDSTATRKKGKVIWSHALHNQFLEAIERIGLDKAVPKKVLEVMNVPGLTRENVASHLQKYRIFLRRVYEATYKIQSEGEKSMVGKTIGATFPSGQAASLYNRLRMQHPQQQLTASFHQTHGGHSQIVEFNNQWPSLQPGKPLYFGTESNNHSGLVNGTDFIQPQEPNTDQIAPPSFNTVLSNYSGLMRSFTDTSELNPLPYAYAGLQGGGLINEKKNGGSGDDLAHGVYASAGFGSLTHVSPAMITNVNDHFGLLKNVPYCDGNSLLLQFDEGDLSSFTDLLSQVNIPSPTQQDGEDDLSSFTNLLNQINIPSPNQQNDESLNPALSFMRSHNAEDKPQKNKHSLHEEHDNDEFLKSLFGNGECGILGEP